MTAQLHPHATITVAGQPGIVPATGQITLDSFSIPYGTANVDIPRTDDLGLEDMDPRQDVRVTISATNTGHWEPIPPTYTPWLETRRNHFPNPNFEAGTAAGWTPENGATVSVESVAPISGLHSGRLIGPGDIYAVQDASVGELWTFSMDYRTEGTLTGAPRLYLADFSWLAGQNAIPLPLSQPTAARFAITLPYPLPEGSGDLIIAIFAPDTGAIIFDNVMLERVGAAGTYFDGNTPDTDLRRYEWTNGGNGSPSTEETRDVATPEGRVWVPDPPRTFDLGLRSREIGDNGRAVSLVLATDEALLQDHAALTVDTGAFTHQASLRAVVGYVLAKIGATLAAGGGDTPVTTYSTSTNAIKNPAAIVDLTGWGLFGLASFTRQTAATWAANTAQTAFRLYGTVGNTNTYIQYAWGTEVSGRRLMFRARHRNGGSIASPGANAVRLNVYYATDGGSGFILAGSVQGSTAANGQADVAVVADIPRNATTVIVRLFHGFSSADSVFWSDVMARDYAGDPYDVAYWDGSTLDTATYRYDWQGTVGASTSTRTALVDRPPEVLIWLPGVTAWAFLEPLCTRAGFRLFSDEKRVWRLVKPSEYTLPGIIAAAPFNTVDGADTISREDADVFCTGVVVIYRWKDAVTLDEKVAYDAAGSPSKVFVTEYERPYPGPGAAAEILARRAGTGRVQTVVALANWATTPGMEASITLPVAGQTRGKVASVRFSLGTDALMDLGTRGLVDVPAGSIDAMAGTIDALVGTIDAQ